MLYTSLKRLSLVSLIYGTFFLFSSCRGSSSSSMELHIISTNDIHGHALVSNERTIGYNRIANYAQHIRNQHPHVLLLDAGDFAQGTPAVNLTRGMAAIQAMNAAEFDFAVLGNHEFDFGSDRVFELIEAANFPILSANAIYQNRENAVQAYESLLMGDVLVAIIGVTTPETAWKTMPSHVQDWEFIDPSIALRPIVERLSLDHQVIIVLAHLGTEGDYTSVRLAQEVPGIHVIIDGHDHTVTPHGLWVNETFIMNTGEHSQNLAHTTIRLTNGQISSIEGIAFDLSAEELNAGYQTYPNALTTQQLMLDIQEQVYVQLGSPVATINVALEGTRDIVRTQETNLGRLITDSFRSATNAEIAVIGGGGIRTSIVPGVQTYENILTVMPFLNSVQVINITGTQLMAALEHSVSAYPEPFGGFLHVSGMSFSFDPNRPAGSRVVTAMVGGNALNLNQTYSIAMPNFLVEGGDGFSMFTNLPYQQFLIDSDIFINYIVANTGSNFPNIVTPRVTMVSN